MEIGEGRSYVKLSMEAVGQDLSIQITGGERPHVGAVAVAWQKNEDVVSSLLVVPGHRDGQIAADCARAICSVTGNTVTVQCGIHIDQATAAEIKVLSDHANQLIEQLRLLLEKQV